MLITINGQQTEVQLIFDLSRGEWNPADKDKKVDFAKANAAAIVAAYFRDANGKYPDTTAPTFEQDADAVGMPWGDFGTIYANTDYWGTIPDQANEFVDNAKSKTVGKMPLVIDWEVEGVTWQMARQYILIVQSAFLGKEIIIYSRAEFLNRYLPDKNKYPAEYKWFTQFAIWQAQYAVTSPSPLPDGFTRIMWQFTDRADASLYGIHPLEAKAVDMSYFFGTVDQFRTRFGLLPPPPKPDPVPTLEERVSTLESKAAKQQAAIDLLMQMAQR